MHNMILTVHLQVNSKETAKKFAKVLSKTMPMTAETAVDISDEHDARVRLGLTELVSNPGEFKPNGP